MSILLTFLVTIALMANLFGIGCAQTAWERRLAVPEPPVSERIPKESVTGRVNAIGTTYVSMQEDNGHARMVRVDNTSEMDWLDVGDQVKADMSDHWYASAIQEVAD